MESPLKKRIQHFLHPPHKLKLMKDKRDKGFECDGCKKSISGQYYCCKGCPFYLHKSCAMLPQRIQHFFHPCPLNLGFISYTCNACFESKSGFSYRCEDCDFDMDFECARLPDITCEGEDEYIQHFSHLHPLKVFSKIEDYDIYCKVCEELCSSTPFYGCSQCQFFLHNSCLHRLLQKTQHLFHPCPLVLLTTPSYECDACDKIRSGLTFRCGKCRFQLCLACFLLPTIQSGGEGKIQHFLHRHPLILVDKQISDNESCNACRKICSGPVYVCRKCDFLLHSSCAKLPQEYRNFYYHPSCALTLMNETGRCDLCLNRVEIAFRCDDCDFQVDVDCVSLTPTIKSMDDKHLLTIVDKVSGTGRLKCNACKESCSGSPAFRCLKCNFNLHLLCGPLPCTIKHESHIDPLIFMDYLIDDVFDEFVCDICENDRDPLLSVYYCPSCPVVADIECVISEVMASLKGERGTVELRTVYKGITGKAISKDLVARELEHSERDRDFRDDDTERQTLYLDNLVDSFTEDEEEEYNNALKIIKGTKASSEDDDISEYGESGTDEEFDHPKSDTDEIEDSSSEQSVTPYSDEAFTELMERLDSHTDLDDEGTLQTLFRHEMRLVNFEQYKIPRIFVPILKDLSLKYGDLCAESMLSPGVKSLLLSLLCARIHRMRTTKVDNITKSLLGDWWAFSKGLQKIGFKTDFALDHLKLVASAHFGIEAKKFVDGTLTAQQKKMGLISERIDKLTASISNLRAKHGEIEKQRHHLITHVESATTSSMRQHLSNGSTLRWKSAADGLLRENIFSTPVSKDESVS